MNIVDNDEHAGPYQDYEPANPFTSMYKEDDSSWTHNVWIFLNEAEQLIRMQVAMELNKAPLAAVAPYIENYYKQELTHNQKARQLVRHMVGQICVKRLRATKLSTRISIPSSKLFTIDNRYICSRHIFGIGKPWNFAFRKLDVE